MTQYYAIHAHILVHSKSSKSPVILPPRSHWGGRSTESTSMLPPSWKGIWMVVGNRWNIWRRGYAHIRRSERKQLCLKYGFLYCKLGRANCNPQHVVGSNSEEGFHLGGLLCAHSCQTSSNDHNPILNPLCETTCPLLFQTYGTGHNTIHGITTLMNISILI